MISTHFVSRISLQRDKVDSFDRYPFSLPAFRGLDQIDLHPKMTIFVGENGSGKSTLLEAIAVSLGFNAEGGGKNFSFGTRPSHSPLHEYLRVAKGVRRPKDAFFRSGAMSNTKKIIVMQGGISMLMLLAALALTFSAPQVFGRSVDWWRGAIALTIAVEVVATLVGWRRASRR